MPKIFFYEDPGAILEGDKEKKAEERDASGDGVDPGILWEEGEQKQR